MLFKEQRFISTKDLSERDLIGEQIDGCQDKMGYLQDQISELQNTIASVDNDNAKACFFAFFSMVSSLTGALAYKEKEYCQ